MKKSLNIQQKNHDVRSEVSNGKRRLVLIALSFMLIATGLLNDSFVNIAAGIRNIIMNRSNLLTDYIALGGIGAAFVNSGLTALLAVAVIVASKATITGPVMAAVFSVVGYSFFGKNLYNSIPIYLGVLLYCKVSGTPYKNCLTSALFGTCLGPAVSQVSFGIGLSPAIGIPAGYATGLVIGFLMQPIASRVVKLHNGLSLYNIGFAAGVIGLAVASVLRLFGCDLSHENLLSSGYKSVTLTFLLLILTLTFVLGFWIHGKTMKNYGLLLKNSGQAVADFIDLYGYGLTLMNMAFVGYILTFYALLVGAEINGPVMGCTLMATGFGAFGKHPRNIIPVLTGIYLASVVGVYETHATGVVVAAVFGTALAPIAGKYGAVAGVLAGAFHLSIVMNTGYLHAGMNLYNNGFSAGFVGGILDPILEIWTSKMKKEGSQ